MINRIITKTKLIHIHNRFNFAIVNKNKNKRSYPYKFGGITAPTAHTSNNNNRKQMVKKIFGQNVLQGYKGAYVAVLSALKQKQKLFLQKNLEKGLTKNIQFEEVDLVHEDSEIDASVQNIIFVLGGKTIRTQDNCKWTPLGTGTQSDGLSLYIQQNFMNSMRFQFPILIGCEVYFKGKTKLIRNGQKNTQNNIEYHSMQFQIDNSMSLAQMPAIMSKMKSNLVGGDIEQIFKEFISKNYEWTIADIDKVLNGNFQI